MKKIMTLTTILFCTALISSSAFAWWGGGMMGDRHGVRYHTANTADRQAYYNATEDLRATLAGDQAELNAIQTGTNPDPAQINTLTRKIVKEQDQLRAQAEKYHVIGTDDDSGYCPYYGQGHHGGHMMGWDD